MSASKLIRPNIEFKESYIKALDEFHAENRFLYQNRNHIYANFEDFVNLLNTEKKTTHRPFENWVEPVPETVLWLTKDIEYIGSISIRHRLNWHLEKWGGHIHFAVRPSMRKKGYGKKIIKKAIPYVNYLGIDKALITIDPENHSAKKIIEFFGGKEDETTSKTTQFPSQIKYWLDCT